MLLTFLPKLSSTSIEEYQLIVLSIAFHVDSYDETSLSKITTQIHDKAKQLYHLIFRSDI